MTTPRSPIEDIEPQDLTIVVEGWNARDIESRRGFEASLRSLANQTFPIADSRVVVILDREADEEEAEWIKERFPTAEICWLENATYYRTKNLALRVAETPFLALVDSDVIYQPDWIEHMLGSFGPGVQFVVGDTKYQDGFLKHTLDLADWIATVENPGFTSSFYANNLVLRRQLYDRIEFRTDMGGSGGGGSDVLRHDLVREGTLPWYAAEAKGVHDLPAFLYKRLRIGAFQIRYRRMAPDTPYAWTANLGILSPFIVVGGTLVKAWARMWRLRSTLPKSPWSLPWYVLSLSYVKAVECVGALLYVVAADRLNRRFGWFDA